MVVPVAFALFFQACHTPRPIVNEQGPVSARSYGEPLLAFTVPQYSIVAFRPNPADETYDAATAAAQGAAMDELIQFFGGAVSTECPMMTIEDEAGYVEDASDAVNRKPKQRKMAQGHVRFENRTGTYIFHNRPDDRKNPYGVIISNGIDEPQVFWGASGYLRQVQRVFKVRDYAGFRDSLSARHTQWGNSEMAKDGPTIVDRNQSAAEATVAPKSIESLTADVSTTFIAKFLAQRDNARWVFYAFATEGVEKKVTETYMAGEEAPSARTTEWMDTYGFPERTVTESWQHTEKHYRRSPEGLIIGYEEVVIDSTGAEQVERIRFYAYASDRVVEYEEQSARAWLPVRTFFLDEQLRIFREVNHDRSGRVEREVTLAWDDHGNLVEMTTRSDSHNAMNLYTYDGQNRQISAWFNQPLMEEGADFGFREETVYSDDGRKSETTTYREGKEPEKSVTYYNDRGHVVRAVFASGMEVHYTYRYRTDS